MSDTEKQVKSREELLKAKTAREAAEKAEVHQAIMSLYIPLSLFISCCILAAGVYMIYYGEPAGWGFIGVTCLLAITAFIALFKFQNKFRAKGIIPTKDTVIESNVVDASPTGEQNLAPKKVPSGESSESESAAGESFTPAETAMGRPAEPAATK